MFHRVFWIETEGLTVCLSEGWQKSPEVSFFFPPWGKIFFRNPKILKYKAFNTVFFLFNDFSLKKGLFYSSRKNWMDG